MLIFFLIFFLIHLIRVTFANRSDDGHMGDLLTLQTINALQFHNFAYRNNNIFDTSYKLQNLVKNV